MTVSAIAVLAPAALLLLIFIVPWLLRRRTRQLEAFMVIDEEFFSAAEALVKEEGVPEAVVNFIEFLANHIDSAAPSRLFLRIAVSGQLRDLNEKSNRFEEFQRQVGIMRPEMKKLFYKATVHFVIASSFRSFFLGAILRRLIFSTVARDPEGAGIAVEAYADRSGALPDGNPA